MVNARTRVVVQALLALIAAVLCWVDVSWALHRGLFPYLDEISTQNTVVFRSCAQLANFFPTTYYADRPTGWVFLKLMGDWFGFDYRRQVACLIAIHFANCGLAFWLFRRLGVSIPVAIAGVGLFGSLWTTAQTATYLGEAFDPICLFFLLGCVLAMLAEREILSAILFLAALRSKEFAIVTPFLLTVLVALRVPRVGLGLALLRRLWLHYLILIVFGLRYVFLYRAYKADLAPDNLYRMDVHVSTVLRSLAYYTGLVFGKEESWQRIPLVLLGVVLVVILGWAILRRRAGIAFGLTAYVMTALPVLLMPHIRAAYWIYAPQVFLILALGLMAEEGLAFVPKRMRWISAVGLAVGCLGWCAAFRNDGYFRDRVSWITDVRRISARTARDVNAGFPRMGPGTHVYVSHVPDATPWLFVAGPCSYLRIVNREESITCVLDAPRATYEKDAGPKYLVDYREDGSVTLQ